MGISGAVFSFSSVIGPFVGGIFTDKLEYVYKYNYFLCVCLLDSYT